MKNLSLVLLAMLLSHSAAQASNGGRGGGDICEDRIKVIRDDISSWIHKGGAEDLKLPTQKSYKQYEKAMLAQITKTQIQCVGHGDAGYPVRVGGTPKVCRFDHNGDRSQITCDATKFLQLKDSDQYVLVHHEYAGLAGIEMPNGADSHYEVSNQISGDLVDEVVKKLAVKARSSIQSEPALSAQDQCNKLTYLHVDAAGAALGSIELQAIQKDLKQKAIAPVLASVKAVAYSSFSTFITSPIGGNGHSSIFLLSYLEQFQTTDGSTLQIMNLTYPLKNGAYPMEVRPNTDNEGNLKTCTIYSKDAAIVTVQNSNGTELLNYARMNCAGQQLGDSCPTTFLTIPNQPLVTFSAQ